MHINFKYKMYCNTYIQLHHVFSLRGHVVHNKVWICKYCKTLISPSIAYGPPNAILVVIHLKSLMPYIFSPNMLELKIFKSICLGSLVNAPCHHDPIWRYCENWVHHHLSPYCIMIGPLYAIPTWMLFYVFS